MDGPFLTFTRVSRSGDHPSTEHTQYIGGRNTRFENRQRVGADIERAQIANGSLQYIFDLDLQRRIFTASRVDGPARSSAAMQAVKRSGKTIHTLTETIDTAERREFFGYTARRVITKTRRTRDSQLMCESERDAWYIDSPAAWLNLNPQPKDGVAFHLVVGGKDRDDYEFTEVGKPEAGFALLSKEVTKMYLDEGSVHEHLRQEEITAFSEASLSPDLFVPPTDFKRVSQLPDGAHYRTAYRMWLCWEMAKDSRHLKHKMAGMIQ